MSAHHAHGEVEHEHPRQGDLEDAPLTHHMALTEAVAALLLEKGVITADRLRRTLETIDARSPADGARVVVRAWADPGFKALLLEDANAAAAALGIDAGHIPIRALESTASVHNLVVCTLCSCYPRLLLGLPPAWYKSRAYRARAVREPRAVLAEMGLVLDPAVQVEVHDSTADLRYMVLPTRPRGTEGWDEAALAGIVTRDCMIGTALPRVGWEAMRAAAALLLALLSYGGAHADQDDPRLEPLFERLEVAADATEAHLLEQAIWTAWLATDDPVSARLMEDGTLALAGRQWAAAEAAFDALVERAPRFAEAWNKRATYHWVVRDLGASLRDIRQTLALEPRHFGALSGLGLVLMEAGEIEGAIKSFEAALAIHPFLPGAREHVRELRQRRSGEPL